MVGDRCGKQSLLRASTVEDLVNIVHYRALST